MGKGRAPTDQDGLTEKQRRFVEAYMGAAKGNGTEAARIAGYAGTDQVLSVTASDNLRKPCIVAALQKRVAGDPKVATRKRRQRFWTKVMLDPEAEMRDRLRASELLGKCQGDFIERHEHTGRNGGPIAVRAADMSDDELAAIIAAGEKEGQ